MDLWISKLIAFFLIFTLMAICGLLPIKVADWFHKKGEKGRHYLSVISCFGGGVFFGAYLMHMAPEVREQLDEALLTPYDIFYPIPELMTAVGFFLLLFIDKFAMMLSHKSDNQITVSGNINEYDNHNFENNGGIEMIRAVKHTAEIDRIQSENYRPSSPRLQARRLSKSQDIVENDNVKPITNGDFPSENGKVQSMANGSAVEKVEVDVPEPEHGGSDDDLSARPYIFLVALSIDCIFEGISLGLQTTSSGVWILVIAILSHETVICFSFGLRILKLFDTKKVIILIISYSATIPIGCIIGFIIFQTAGTSDEIDIVSGMFLAISAGIFIYVSFFEILNEELTHDSHISKVVAVAVGFVFMALMVLVDLIEGGDGGGGGIDGNTTTAAYGFSNLIMQIKD